MHRSTRAPRACWSQVFQKSACIEEAPPDDSVTSPGVVGIRKLALTVNVGTGMGWVPGHRRLPSLLSTLRAMCDLWSALSVLPLEQSGKTIRKPRTPPPHRVGGVFVPAAVSLVPQLHVMRLALITLRSATKGLTCVWSLPLAR